MKHRQPILERVGLTLVLLGVIEVYLIIWKLACTLSPGDIRPILLNVILATMIVLGLVFVVPGILLLRGGLMTAKILRYLALFGLALSAVNFLVMPLLLPFGLHWVSLKLDPVGMVVGIWDGLVYLAFPFWLQALLGSREVADAQIDHRITPPSTWPALSVGCVCGLLYAGGTYWLLHGSAATDAVQRVKAKYGDRYAYFANKVTYISETGDAKVIVSVIGYNSSEIVDFTISTTTKSPVEE